MVVMPTIFERLERPAPPKKAQETSPEQKLLNFLQRWPKDTISLRDITLFGPSMIRTQRTEFNTAEVLVQHGWLAPIQGPYRNSRQWQVMRRPTVHPIVEL
jgi:hypothetical protein